MLFRKFGGYVKFLENYGRQAAHRAVKYLPHMPILARFAFHL